MSGRYGGGHPRRVRCIPLLCLLASASCYTPISKVQQPSMMPYALRCPRYPPPRCSERPQETKQTARGQEPPDDGWPLKLPGADFFARNVDRPQIELFNAACVASALLLFAVQTLEYSPEVRALLQRAEQSIALGFGFEYMIRWYSQNLNPRHVVQPQILLDLLSFFPTLLQLLLPIAAGVALDKLGMSNDPQLVVLYGKVYYGLSAWAGADFVFLRLVRLIKLQRFLLDSGSFSSLQLELGMEPRSIKPWQLQLARAFSSIFALLVVASGCLYEAEPQIPDYFTALYYGVQVLTNGNDAIVPATTEGRFAVTGSILAGVAIIPLQVSKLAQAYFQREQDTCVVVEGQGDIDEAYCLFPGSEPGSEPGTPADASSAELTKAQADVIAARVLLLLDEREAARQEEARVTETDGATCANCGATGHHREATFCYRCSDRISADSSNPAD